ncbi:hypothetical protein [Streptomyces sp. NPDC001348]
MEKAHWLKGTLRASFRLVEPSDAARHGIVGPGDAASHQACPRLEYLVSVIAVHTGNGFLAFPRGGEFHLDSHWG